MATESEKSTNPASESATIVPQVNARRRVMSKTCVSGGAWRCGPAVGSGVRACVDVGACDAWM